MQELGMDITTDKTGDWRLAEVDWLTLQTMQDILPKDMKSLQRFFHWGGATCSDCILKRSL